MVESIRMRVGTPDDADRIHAMLRALARDVGSEGRVSSVPEDLRRHLQGDRPDLRALLAYRGHARTPGAEGEAVGLCLYFFSFSSWRGQRGVYVQDIWVDPSERGSGLAQRLIAETARRAAAEGARYLRLSVDRDNAPARSFYARIGLGHAAHECIYMATGPAFEALTGIDGAADSGS